MDSARRPAALLPAPLARTLGFTLLALLGASEWSRMLEGGGLSDVLPWVLAAVLAGEVVAAAGTLPARLRGPAAALAAALGLLLAALVSGLEPRLLAPAHWSELGDGVARGLDALSSVTLPYGGVDPWPDVTLRLGGSLLVGLAAVFAAWPRREARGYPFFALAGLLTLVATPVTAVGTPRSLVLGTALAALTICFLWLERLPLRPGLGVAVLGGLALAGALPLSVAADRDSPWFDYRTFAEGLGSPASVRFNWDHTYGPLRWQRDGREMLRIKSARPQYWKLENLEEFDGQRWGMTGVPDPYGPEPEADLDQNWNSNPQWTGTAEVTVRGLRGTAFAGAGTTLAVDAGGRSVLPTFSPGTWQSDQELKAGDSYRVRFHAPRPNPLQLSAATSGANGQQGDALDLVLPLLRPLLPDPRTNPRGRRLNYVKLELRPYGEAGGPIAQNERSDTSMPGVPVLHNSPYWRTWQLAQRLRRGTRTPYEFVRRVDNYFDHGFRYDEHPTDVPDDPAPLEHFLFDTKAGYCQHFSGAMALLLRFGGVPARVATGFSPGGYRRAQREWVIRDTDAHSWVEAWFDGIGWVTFDPTVGGTPARSLIAAIDPPGQAKANDAAADVATAQPGTRNPAGARRELDPSSPQGGGAGASDRGPGALTWGAAGLGVVVLVLAGVALLRARRRPALPPAERAVADLVVALRRAGRPVAPGVTLIELERRLAGTAGGADYLTALRAARYGAAAPVPTAAQRRAFRRELAAGLGWSGRLRSWWALPPHLR